MKCFCAKIPPSFLQSQTNEPTVRDIGPFSDDVRVPEVGREAMLESRTRELAVFPLVIAVLAITSLAVRYHSQTQWIRHTLEVEQRLESLQSTLIDAEKEQREFLLTSSREFLPHFEAAVRLLPTEIADIQSLTQDNPQQQKLLSELKPMVEKRMGRLRDRVQEYLQGNPDLTNMEIGNRLMGEIRGKLSEMRSVEADRFDQRTARSRNFLLTSLALLTVLLSLFAVMV
jgi:CHASE3 domain sensor protein